MATAAEDLIRHHRFTVDEYRRMGETGIFHEDDRVELIEGEIIEIAESSLRYELEVKLPLYAGHGTPAVWLVDLQNGRLLMFSEPEETGYRKTDVANMDHSIALPALTGLAMDLSGLFRMTSKQMSHPFQGPGDNGVARSS